MPENNKRILVAMSGGVDSSVVAAILAKKYENVLGVTMCLGVKDDEFTKCCGMKAINDAKEVCRKIGIPHYVLDFSKELERYVIEDFVSQYLSGFTPNPCVRCNVYLKFGKLLSYAKSIDCNYIATGHYARIVPGKKKDIFYLKKGKDNTKDQSYFLNRIGRKLLPQILFPLGDLTKENVRKLAKKFNLPTAGKEASQDICFIPEEGYKKFIESRISPEKILPGDFIDYQGKVVGRHKGILNYTIGQRDKLGLALGYRTYVYRIDPKSNQVFVGPRELLFSQGLIAGDFNDLGLNLRRGETRHLRVKIRYNASAVRSKIKFMSGANLKITFSEPQTAVTPGQSVVIYGRDTVLGGAIITSSF